MHISHSSVCVCLRVCLRKMRAIEVEQVVCEVSSYVRLCDAFTLCEHAGVQNDVCIGSESLTKQLSTSYHVGAWF